MRIKFKHRSEPVKKSYAIQDAVDTLENNVERLQAMVDEIEKKAERNAELLYHLGKIAPAAAPFLEMMEGDSYWRSGPSAFLIEARIQLFIEEAEAAAKESARREMRNEMAAAEGIVVSNED